MPPPTGPQFPLFLPELMVTVFAGIAYLYFSRNVPIKRIVLPISLLAAAGLALTMLSSASKGHPPWFFVCILFVSLLATYRGVVFCSSCGQTVRGSFLRPAEFCPSCGARTQR